MKYDKSRDLVWEILLRNGVSSLPIDVMAICAKEKITVFSYRLGKSIIEDLGLEENMKGNDAFSIGSIILYDDTQSSERCRFSIAHELGHALLHASDRAIPTVYNREPSPSDDPIEAEANIFASRLLAPLCVLQFLNLNSPTEIAEFCNISYSAAKIRFERLCQIRKRNSERLKAKNHGTFLISKLERRVLENFKDFIEKNKKPYSSGKKGVNE